MATTRSLCFHLAIFTILSIFIDINCQTPPSANSSLEDTCINSSSEIEVQLEPFFNSSLKWKKPLCDGLISYDICLIMLQQNKIIEEKSKEIPFFCEEFNSSDECPTFKFQGYMDIGMFYFRIEFQCPENQRNLLSSSKFNSTEIMDACKLRENVKVFNVTETSAIVQWEKLETCNYKNVQYLVFKERQFRNGSFDDNYDNVTSSTFNETNVTVNDLIPGMKYKFRLDLQIIPYTTGAVFSSDIRIKHPLDSKIDTYLKEISNLDKLIKVIDITDTTANIQWNTPENISTAAKMDVFIIDSSNNREAELVDDFYPNESDNYVHRISYLKPGKNYIFLVAFTDDEDVHFLISKEIITDITSDGCELIDYLEVFNVTETSAILHWEKPEICAYKNVHYSVSKKLQFRNGSIPIDKDNSTSFLFNDTNITVNDLIPGMKYIFTLYIQFNPNIIGEFISEDIRIKHPLDSKIDSYLSETSNFTVLDKLIKVIDVTDRTANIQWSKPENISTAAKIDVFIIDSSNNREAELVDDFYPNKSDNYVHRISYLKPGKNYTFLIAFTDGEDVHFLISKEIITENPSEKPNKPPGSLDYSYDNTTNTILLKWNKPENSPTTVKYILYIENSGMCGQMIYDISEHPTYNMSVSTLPKKLEITLWACNNIGCSLPINNNINIFGNEYINRTLESIL
ncbi:uncharacterized protein LOC127283919 [Leptopilina boulardi]|uniref:uncharacterized protein LOC127283919 n=1 Tax=Leptopilina boulardi TaxID=63433 RepID=UPI0021F65189|nr:uncharacterized protein LOC127283919 [Leptopilina boulardi]